MERWKLGKRLQARRMARNEDVLQVPHGRQAGEVDVTLARLTQRQGGEGSQVLTFQNVRAIQAVDPEMEPSQVLQCPKDIYVQRILQAVDGEHLHCGEIAKAREVERNGVVPEEPDHDTFAMQRAKGIDLS